MILRILHVERLFVLQNNIESIIGPVKENSPASIDVAAHVDINSLHLGSCDQCPGSLCESVVTCYVQMSEHVNAV